MRNRTLLPAGLIMTAPVRDIDGHQGFEESTVRRNFQMQQFVDDDEILKPALLFI